MKPAREVKLKVAEAIQDDVNKGIVRIDTSYMNDIGIRPGDIIEIEGERKTVAIADRAYPGDIGLNIIRIDGIIRKNAKTGIGEFLIARKADVKEAKKISIAPARKGIIIRASTSIFKQGLLGRAVMKGDIVSLGGTRQRRSSLSDSPFFDDVFNILDESMMGFGFGDIKFIVADVLPKQAVIITDATEVIFNPEAVEVEDEELPEVSYEDIGGLEDEIKKIREMVELPLKHPEIFAQLGVEPPKGVLLHGPPGTGKTLLAKAVANETNSHFILINGPEIMCVGPDTPIFTNPRGYKKAKQIFDNANGKVIRDDKIKVVELKEPIKSYGIHNNKLTKVKITHVAKLNAPTYKVSLSDGNQIDASQNQPFLVYEDGNLVWKKVSELKKGSFVARANQIDLPQKSYCIPVSTIKNLISKQGKYAIKSKNLSRSNFISLPKKTSDELLELLGLLFSEGNISLEKGAITFANNDPVLREHFISLARSLYDIDNISEYKDGRVVIYSKLMIAHLELLGLSSGKKTDVLPNFLYKLPKSQVAAFIRGYFDGDGTVALSKLKDGVYPTPKIYCKSRAFLQQMQGLLQLKLNISTKLSDHNTPKGMMYALVVRGREGREIFAQIGARSVEKQRRLELIKKVTKVNEFAHIPFPSRLVQEMRKSIAYKKYRNNDLYMYEKADFTAHAYNKLFAIAQAQKIVTSDMQQEQKQLLRNDIAWEKIVDITFEGNKEVYDFTVDKDNFMAAPYILLHNSKYYGQSEENLRKKFEEAEKNAPSIVFIDEIDAIATKREETRGEVERRVVAQMLALMDGLQTRGKVVVIGATNVPNILDPALRRPGRFDREVEIGVPSKEGRLNILKIHTRNMPILPTFDEDIARSVMDKFENRLGKEIKELEGKIRAGEGNKVDHEQEIAKDKARVLAIAQGKPKMQDLLLKNQQKVIEVDAKVMKQILDLLAKDIIAELKKSANNTDLLEAYEAFGTDLSRKVFLEADDKDGRKKLIRQHLEELGLDKVFLAEIVDNEVADKIIDKTKDAAIKKRIQALLGVGFTEEEKQRKLWDSLKEIDTEVSDDVYAKSKELMLKNVADITHGFVGADLASVAKESAMIVLRRLLPDLRLNDEETIPQEMLEKLRIREKDLRETLKFVRPSAMREVLVEVPNIKWNDVGGLEDVKRELKEVVEWPIRHPEAFKRMGINPPKGILLYGPPGVGKTMLAKAVANESQANFILVKGPELFSKWVGESEKAVRRIFEKARQTSPTIVFFDELDALAPMRGGGMGGESNVTERVVNQLLTEIDGLEDLHDVVVIGATNRPDIIDAGLLRPGRFDRVILVISPTESERLRIFEVHTKSMPLDKDVKLKELAKRTEGYVGSDIESVCREAAIFTLRDDMKASKVGMIYFEKALKKVGPSVTKDVEDVYKQFSTQFRQMKAKKMKAETNYMG